MMIPMLNVPEQRSTDRSRSSECVVLAGATFKRHLVDGCYLDEAFCRRMLLLFPWLFPGLVKAVENSLAATSRLHWKNR